MRWTRTAWIAAPISAAVLSVALLGVGSTVPPYLWRAGSFTDQGVAVYPEPVDGWGCHVLEVCRSDVRGPDDLAAIYSSEQPGQPVVIECSLGAYYKLATPRPGWVAKSMTRAASKPVPCYSGDL